MGSWRYRICRNIHIRLWMERRNSISQEFYLPEVNPFQKKHSILKSATETQTICNYADQSQMVNIMSLSKSCGIDRYAALTPWIFCLQDSFIIKLFEDQQVRRLPGCLKCSTCLRFVCTPDVLFAFNSGISLGTRCTPSHLREIIQ